LSVDVESSQTALLLRDVRPPNFPWVPLAIGNGGRAALSFYYSDPKSDVPVREIMRPYDNKADPNLETMTYGLFSTCERRMRVGIVRRGIDLIFFCTNRDGPKVLTGYYRVGWYFKMPSTPEDCGLRLDDFALAARAVRFVAPGFPLPELTGYLNGKEIGTKFRPFRYLEMDLASRLFDLLSDTPDATPQYLSEIHRLEQTNLSRYGYLYKNRDLKTGFNWETAPMYMGLLEKPGDGNASPAQK
jgi:hypothetical protein